MLSPHLYVDTEIGLQLLFLKRAGIRESFGRLVTEEKKNGLSSISTHSTQSVLLQKVSLTWDSAFLCAVLFPKLKDLQTSTK